MRRLRMYRYAHSKSGLYGALDPPREPSNWPVFAAVLLAIMSFPAMGKESREKWAASWTTGMHQAYAPFPGGFHPLSNQPDLGFAFADASNEGAVNQTFRMIVKPDLWGRKMRLHFSNLYGRKPVTFNSVMLGL